MIPQKLLECVANISEGQSSATITALGQAISQHCSLLHTDISPSAHRTVFTFAGTPQAVMAAASALCQQALALIDMRQHRGAHPRLGAVDVLPFVPLAGITAQEANRLTLQLAEQLAQMLQIPIYLYELSASHPHRAALPAIRKGQYEGLSDKILQKMWQPDYYFPQADTEAMERGGAIIMGVRPILVAYNISLATREVGIAQDIAGQIRSSGYKNPKTGRQQKGMFGHLRAIGWYLAQYGVAQVSCNFLDYRHTDPWAVWQAVQQLAAVHNTIAVGCEVIGLIPKECILAAGRTTAAASEGEAAMVAAGIAALRLNAVRPFDPEEKILEYALYKAGLCADRSAIAAIDSLS